MDRVRDKQLPGRNRQCFILAVRTQEATVRLGSLIVLSMPEQPTQRAGVGEGVPQSLN